MRLWRVLGLGSRRKPAKDRVQHCHHQDSALFPFIVQLVISSHGEAGAPFTTIFSSIGSNQASAVEDIADADVNDRRTSHGTVHAVRVALAPGEARILARPQ